MRTTNNGFVICAWLNAFRKRPRHYWELSVSAIREHAGLVEELGGGPWHHASGALHWEDDPKRAAELHEAGERMRSPLCCRAGCAAAAGSAARHGK